MPIVDINRLRVPRRHSRRYERLWREWCFLRLAFRHFRVRMLLIVGVLVIGGLLFKYLEPEKNHSLARATYFTWCLVFGESPEAFPKSVVLQALFFIVPIVGLTFIIEGLVDLALIVRDRRRCERGWCKVMASSMSKHIVLVGLGRLGFRTFLLLRHLGEQVVVIERDPACEFLEVVREDGSALLIGDARRESLLEDANIRAAKSIVTATNDDLANLEISLDARKLHPAIRVVMRMFDQNMADKVREGFNIHMAMSPSALAAPAFATASVERSMVNSYVVGDELVVMQRWRVRDGGPLCGRTVAEVMVDYRLGVIERRAGHEHQVFPAPDTRLKAGDALLVQGLFETLTELKSRSGVEVE